MVVELKFTTKQVRLRKKSNRPQIETILHTVWDFNLIASISREKQWEQILTKKKKRKKETVNSLKCSGVRQLHLKSFQCHPGLTYIFNFWHSGTLALKVERQGARMSEIKNVG